MKTQLSLILGLLLIGTLAFVACSGGGGRGEENANSSLFVSRSAIDPGPICANGGVQISMGFDVNRNNNLDPDEITKSENVCNGTDSSTHPFIVYTNPTPNEIEVPSNSVVSIVFNTEMDASTITPDSVVLKDNANNVISGAVIYSNTVATFTPITALAGTKYTLTIASTIKNSLGIAMGYDHKLVFTCKTVMDSPKAITAFNITSPATTGVITEESHTIAITVPYGTNVTALVPTIMHTGASISPASGAANDFTAAKTYTVTAANASTQSYIVMVTVSNIASVTTTDISGNLTFTVNITGVSAKGGGNVVNQGASAVTARGLCWTTSGNPTIGDPHSIDGSGAGVYSNVSLTGLAENTIYHVRAYATNGQGTAYGNEITFNSGYAFNSTERFGGYVFYNNGSGGGLVSAKVDQSISQVWVMGGSTQTTYGNITGQAIGTGQANSNAIINQPGHTGSAAQICLDYNDGIYDDWFLPSLYEIKLMCTNLKQSGIGGFADAPYWTSTEGMPYSAFCNHFGNYLSAGSNKSNFLRVRSVRAF